MFFTEITVTRLSVHLLSYTSMTIEINLSWYRQCLRTYCSNHKLHQLRYFCPAASYCFYVTIQCSCLLKSTARLCVQLHLGSLKIPYWEKTYELTRSTSLYMTPSSLTSATVQPWSIFMLDSRIWCRDSSASNEWLASKSEVNQPFSEQLCIQVNKPAETPNRRLRRSPYDRLQCAILSGREAIRSWRQLFHNLDPL